MAFVRVAGVSDVGPGGWLRVEHGGHGVLLANVDGGFHAVAERCTHRGGSLSKGTMSDGVVTCPRHGARFDVQTGRNVGSPRILLVKGKADDLRSYAVRVEGDDVLVDLG
jgi:nitrite reductase/ring-hydroxylating ferredoxin subunit